MQTPFNWIDYANDSLYGFGKPYFLPLPIGDAQGIVRIFCMKTVTVCTTRDFLQLYEDELSGVSAIRFEHSVDFEEECLEDSPAIIAAREDFREATKKIQDWPLEQVLMSAIFRKLVAYCCPYQNQVWDCQGMALSKKALQIKHLLLTQEADQVVLLIYPFYSVEALQKQKEVRVTNESFWHLIISSIFLNDDNEEFSFKVFDLFLAFANRNNRLAKEGLALREATRGVLYNRTFAKKFLEKQLFFGFMLLPFFTLLDISTLDSRKALIKFVETQQLSVIEDLL